MMLVIQHIFLIIAKIRAVISLFEIDLLILANKKDMESIGGHTNNPIAKRMYENIGFLQVDDKSGSHSYNWYLEKKLGK